MPGTGTILPLAFSQSIFTKEIAPKIPLLLNDEAKKTISTDYKNTKDRDAGMCAVTTSLFVEATKQQHASEKFTGSSEYTEKVLSVYDDMCYGWNVPYLWRGDVEELRDLYRTHVGPSKKHCEFAVGTGLMLGLMVKEGYLKLTGDDADKLTLIDLAPGTISKAVGRLEAAAGAKLSLETKICDVVSGKETVDGAEKDVTPEHYTSVVANLMFHCIHEVEDGDSIEKAVGTISKFVHPTEGVFFGSSILGKDIMDDEGACGASKHAAELVNKLGIMGNLKHDLPRIEKALNAHFDEVDIWKTGHVAVWRAHKPKSS